MKTAIAVPGQLNLFEPDPTPTLTGCSCGPRAIRPACGHCTACDTCLDCGRCAGSGCHPTDCEED
jgi:hypothetical protein